MVRAAPRGRKLHERLQRIEDSADFFISDDPRKRVTFLSNARWIGCSLTILIG
jgi:hypothetical protein